jgi:nucleoside-diphosphate-sugar epimerase
VVSTTTVFGHNIAKGRVDEHSPYQPDLGEYGASKARAERYCLQRANSSAKTRIVVLNPSSIYGRGGWLFTEFPLRAARAGQFAWIEEGLGNFNYTFVDNFVDALLLAAQATCAHGQRFIISDGMCRIREFLTPILGCWGEGLTSCTRQELADRDAAQRPTFRELLRAMMNPEVREMCRRLPIVAAAKTFADTHFENTYARLRATFDATAPAPIERHQRIANVPLWLADIFGPMTLECSSDKAKELLGWTPRVTLEEGQRVSVAWLRELGLYADGVG